MNIDLRGSKIWLCGLPKEARLKLKDLADEQGFERTHLILECAGIYFEYNKNIEYVGVSQIGFFYKSEASLKYKEIFYKDLFNQIIEKKIKGYEIIKTDKEITIIDKDKDCITLSLGDFKEIVEEYEI